MKALFVMECGNVLTMRMDFCFSCFSCAIQSRVNNFFFFFFSVQGKQPSFIQKFGHTTLQEGEDLILHCTIHGKPKPHVCWTKDDIQVVAGDISVCSKVLKIFLGER